MNVYLRLPVPVTSSFEANILIVNSNNIHIIEIMVDGLAC